MQSVAADEARHVRREALATLQAALGADAGAYFRVARVGEENVLVDATVIGCDGVAELFARYQGKPLPVGSASDASTTSRSARRGAWTLGSAPTPLRQSFRTVRDDFLSVDHFMRSPMGREWYQPNEVHDHLRLLPYAGRRSLGWIGVWRRGGGQCFRPRDTERANGLVDTITNALAGALALDSLGEGGPAHVVLSHDGRVELACARAARWLGAEHRALLARLVRAAQSGGTTTAVVDSVTVRLVRLEGAQGNGFLGVLDSEEPVVLRSDSALTTVEREIASLAAAGLRVGEIAEDRGISPNTVKFHLKHVYDKLGVATRIELSRALEQ